MLTVSFTIQLGRFLFVRPSTSSGDSRRSSEGICRTAWSDIHASFSSGTVTVEGTGLELFPNWAGRSRHMTEAINMGVYFLPRSIPFIRFPPLPSLP